MKGEDWSILLSMPFFFSFFTTDVSAERRWVSLLGCVGGAVLERRTRDRKVAGSTPGRRAIKSTRSTQPSIPTG